MVHNAADAVAAEQAAADVVHAVPGVPEGGVGAPPAASAAAPEKRTRHPLAVPVTGIFIILLVQALTVASGFLLPVTAAVLGSLVLNGPRRGLERIGIPAPVTAAVFTTSIGVLLAIAIAMLADPITEFVKDIPTLLDDAMDTLTGPGGLLEPFTEAAEATQEAMGNAADPALAAAPGAVPGAAPAAPAPEPATPVEVVATGGIATTLFAAAPGLLSQTVFAMCLLFFLVASGDLFIQKAVQVADRFQDKRATLKTIRTIERGLGNYLGAIALINAGLGVAIGIAMWLWGLPSPWLLGIMATVLNFIPFVGAVVGAGVAGVTGFVHYADPWSALGVFATYYALTSFEGQFVTPTLVGQRLRLNVVMVFLSVAFFAWIWSVVGMIVAVPMLIVAKVVCDSIPRFAKIGLFLGDAEGFIPRERDAGEEAAK
ncbi:AI-2E family transporter [Jannaschia sp. W003]|uniref:AI-2E family transporter n=1 Tax=Jannaschia sp. W003 TaxID=2867012 RepID=UPI0021A74E53|nr:AI-2E family transporter [Jannaschia sp. W003]UWQ21132.1 AI-2E family transporter [Jannaschia sp. W003]